MQLYAHVTVIDETQKQYEPVDFKTLVCSCGSQYCLSGDGIGMVPNQTKMGVIALTCPECKKTATLLIAGIYLKED